MTKSKTDKLVERIEPKLSKFSCVNGDVQELLKDCKIHILGLEEEKKYMLLDFNKEINRARALDKKLDRLNDTEGLAKILHKLVHWPEREYIVSSNLTSFWDIEHEGYGSRGSDTYCGDKAKWNEAGDYTQQVFSKWASAIEDYVNGENNDR